MRRFRPAIALIALVSASLTLVVALPALGHYPNIEAECVEPDRLISYYAFSWTDDERGSNPKIGIYFDGERVAEGQFSEENGFHFSGSHAAPEGAQLVQVTALAEAPFGSGEGEGESRSVTVDLALCPPPTTPPSLTPTTQAAVTPTVLPTTIVATTAVTEQPPTTPTTQTTQTAVEVTVLPTTISETTTTQAPAATTAETLPFTGSSRFDLNPAALVMLAAGLLVVVGGRRPRSAGTHRARRWEPR